jgi:hypothetical protein
MASTSNGKPTMPRQMMAIEIPRPLNILLSPVVNVIDEQNLFGAGVTIINATA